MLNLLKFMYSILVIFAVIGVLITLLFLFKFVLCLILWIRRERKKSDNWSIVRHTMISDNYEDSWFLIPTVMLSKSKTYIEISVKFLKWEYYTNYQLDTDV